MRQSPGLVVEFAQTDSGLDRFLRAAFPELPGALDARELTDAEGLRAAIERALRGCLRGEEPAPEDIDVINLFAATPDIPPALHGGTRQAGRSSVRPAQALSELARSAVTLFADDRERIRECEAADCRIVFYDDSRSANRRWCSMQRCGNRAKVRRHRARAYGTTVTSFQNAT